MGKSFKMINLRGIFSITCGGAIDNTLSCLVGGPEFDSGLWKPFFVFFVKHYFHSLTEVKHTGRLIAGFISKIQ